MPPTTYPVLPCAALAGPQGSPLAICTDQLPACLRREGTGGNPGPILQTLVSHESGVMPSCHKPPLSPGSAGSPTHLPLPCWDRLAPPEEQPCSEGVAG